MTRRRDRDGEISDLLLWNSLIVNGKKQTTRALWAADEVGAAVLLQNLKRLDDEAKAHQRSCEVCFVSDVLSHISREVRIEGANWDDAPEEIAT